MADLYLSGSDPLSAPERAAVEELRRGVEFLRPLDRSGSVAPYEAVLKVLDRLAPPPRPVCGVPLGYGASATCERPQGHPGSHAHHRTTWDVEEPEAPPLAQFVPCRAPHPYHIGVACALRDRHEGKHRSKEYHW